jgi:hypothetical protein
MAHAQGSCACGTPRRANLTHVTRMRLAVCSGAHPRRHKLITKSYKPGGALPHTPLDVTLQ